MRALAPHNSDITPGVCLSELSSHGVSVCLCECRESTYVCKKARKERAGNSAVILYLVVVFLMGRAEAIPAKKT